MKCFPPRTGACLRCVPQASGLILLHLFGAWFVGSGRASSPALGFRLIPRVMGLGVHRLGQSTGCPSPSTPYQADPYWRGAIEEGWRVGVRRWGRPPPPWGSHGYGINPGSEPGRSPPAWGNSSHPKCWWISPCIFVLLLVFSQLRYNAGGAVLSPAREVGRCKRAPQSRKLRIEVSATLR